MKYLPEVCLTGFMLAVVSLVAAQAAPEIPMQRGISVNMPIASHAVPVPDADKEEAVVVVVTRNGDVFVGTTRIPINALAAEVERALSNRNDKTLYIKADARTPYADVVKVVEAVHTAEVERITLLAAQRDAETRAFPVAPKGLELQVVRHAGSH